MDGVGEGSEVRFCGLIVDKKCFATWASLDRMFGSPCYNLNMNNSSFFRVHSDNFSRAVGVRLTVGVYTRVLFNLCTHWTDHDVLEVIHSRSCICRYETLFRIDNCFFVHVKPREQCARIVQIVRRPPRNSS